MGIFWLKMRAASSTSHFELTQIVTPPVEMANVYLELQSYRVIYVTDRFGAAGSTWQNAATAVVNIEGCTEQSLNATSSGNTHGIPLLLNPGAEEVYIGANKEPERLILGSVANLHRSLRMRIQFFDVYGVEITDQTVLSDVAAVDLCFNYTAEHFSN